MFIGFVICIFQVNWNNCFLFAGLRNGIMSSNKLQTFHYNKTTLAYVYVYVRVRFGARCHSTKSLTCVLSYILNFIPAIPEYNSIDLGSLREHSSISAANNLSSGSLQWETIEWSNTIDFSPSVITLLNVINDILEAFLKKRICCGERKPGGNATVDYRATLGISLVNFYPYIPEYVFSSWSELKVLFLSYQSPSKTLNSGSGNRCVNDAISLLTLNASRSNCQDNRAGAASLSTTGKIPMIIDRLAFKLDHFDEEKNIILMPMSNASLTRIN